MQVILDMYDGEFANHPNIVRFFRNFGNMSNTSVETIRKKLGLESPPIIIVVQVVDGMGAIPMFTTTGLCVSEKLSSSDKSKLPDLVHGGNRIRKIKMSAAAIANRYNGFTTAQKVLTHEYVHAYLFYYSATYIFAPKWLMEGIALWTANQTWKEDFSKVPEKYRNDRYRMYLSHIERFQKLLKEENIREVMNKMISSGNPFRGIL